MDIRKIKKLIELLEESDVEELEIHEGDDSVRISRRREQLAAPQYMAQYPSPAPQPASPQPSAPAADEPTRLRRISYAVFCLKKKIYTSHNPTHS